MYGWFSYDLTHLGISIQAKIFQYLIDDYSLHRVKHIPDKGCVRRCCLKVILATKIILLMTEKFVTEEFTKMKKYFMIY